MHHSFKPQHYFNTIGSHEPVLSIKPGDSVFTSTVDAAGCDHTGEQITQRGNPQTGPFYVEGAEPGDTLVIWLDKLLPNRNHGWSAKGLAPNVVDPDYVRNLLEPAEKIALWDLDTTRGTARLDLPGGKPQTLELPLEPMLGCFGVAPARGQAISTATSAEHGGNMDYRGFKEGVKVYFPVFVEGALFFLGDGHALQGDGEIVGTGIEVSMDVSFRVELIKGRQCYWPRGENEDFIFTAGNARPLDQASQHATSEMHRWLVSEFGFDALSASLFMGQAVRYDLGNFFDPAYTMICKIPKHFGSVRLERS